MRITDSLPKDDHLVMNYRDYTDEYHDHIMERYA